MTFADISLLTNALADAIACNSIIAAASASFSNAVRDSQNEELNRRSESRFVDTRASVVALNDYLGAVNHCIPVTRTS